MVKRVKPGAYPSKPSFELIALKPGDTVVGACEVTNEAADIVFVSTDAQLLRTPLKGVSAQGLGAGGMAGMRTTAGAKVISMHLVDPRDADALVVTVAGSTGALPGTDPGSAKVTPLSVYPSKGRGTGGVRVQRFLKSEDTLLLAWSGVGPAIAAGAKGEPVDLPGIDTRRDGSGLALPVPVASVGSLPTSE